MFISYSWNDHFTLLINQKSYLQGINKQFTHAPHLSIMKTSMHWEYIVFKSPKHGGFNMLHLSTKSYPLPNGGTTQINTC